MPAFLRRIDLRPSGDIMVPKSSSALAVVLRPFLGVTVAEFSVGSTVSGESTSEVESAGVGEFSIGTTVEVISDSTSNVGAGDTIKGFTCCGEEIGILLDSAKIYQIR